MKLNKKFKSTKHSPIVRSFRVFHDICPHLHIILENVFRTPIRRGQENIKTICFNRIM